jgi:NAD(P)-dependent dehydrogenase (short-subunit alcohol dehydrogenase family)
MNLAGSQVDVVGGSSGIGRATAKVALAPGGSATIAQEKLRQAQAEFEPSRAMLADVTCEEDVERLFAAVDRVDHLCVSAGQYAAGEVLGAQLESLRFDVAQRFLDRSMWSDRLCEVVPGLVEVEVAVPRLMPSLRWCWASAKTSPMTGDRCDQGVSDDRVGRERAGRAGAGECGEG